MGFNSALKGYEKNLQQMMKNTKYPSQDNSVRKIRDKYLQTRVTISEKGKA